MANKKIFTGYTFEGGGQSKNLRLEAATSDPTNVGKGHAYYNTTAGTIKVSNADSDATASWKTLLTTDSSVPFSSLTGTVDADTLDGSSKSNAVGNNTIPVRDSSNLFHVGSATANPTENTHVANKRYVDSVAQGLTIIDPCYLATTAALPNHSYNNGTSGVGATMTASANGALSIDGNAVSNGKRILVKDQANNAHNGIYTVTNAGSGSAAFVLTRATDYDEQGELLDGDFVFVQEGTVNANRGFVQTSNYWTATTGTVGTHSITWTQFSGAGQISVTSNGSAAAPLTKSGDTINFAYNTDRFALNSNALDVADGGIQTDQLGADSVTPLKLDDSASFTMGGLTVNGGSTFNNTLTISSVGLVTWDTDNFKIRSQSGRGLQLGSGGTHGYLTLTSAGKLGLGADASSPSGTLHVQTARYSTTNKVTDGSAISDTNWDANAGWGFGSGVATFTTGSGTGRVKQDSVFVAADQGKRFKVTFTMSATGLVHIGNSTGNLAYVGDTDSANGTYNSYAAGTHTVWFILPVTGSYDTTTLGFWSQNASGSFSISNISVYEDTLSASTSHTAFGELSVNSAADDLVISNNDHGGLSIITPADKKGTIFFGDKADNDVGTIKYDHVTNSLAFGTDGDGLCLTLASDHSAKFEGGLGVGAVAGAGGQGLTVDKSVDDDWVAKIKNSSNTTPYGLQVDCQGSNTVTAFAVYAGESPNNTTFAVKKTHSYFSSNLVVGGTTAYSGTNVTSLTVDATSYPALALKIGGTTTALINGNSTTLNIDSLGDRNLILRTNDVDRLSFDGSGIQNHHSNPIVNSATVAGLQDGGACYDFDGANTNHIALPTAAYDAVVGDRITVAAWIKRTSDSGVYDGIVAVDGLVNQAEGFALLIDGTDDKLFWQYDSPSGAAQIDSNNSGGQVLALNKWYHVVGIWDGSNLKTYVNGVLDRTQSGAGKALSGTNKTIVIGNQGTNSSAYFRGQIRDVKIFPSALDAGDIRKLYSGENLKKNLNVELVTSWANGSSNGYDNFGTTASGLGLDVYGDSSGTAEGAASNSISITSGDVYLVSFDLTLTSGTAPTVSLVDSATGWSTERSNTVVSAAGTNNIILTANATDSSAHLQFRALNGQATNFDTGAISLTKITTLVDFNPQSASSSKWRNEAIPSLYHGTVNNATLSQGNSYWNNIKQDGQATTVDGSLEIQTASGGELNFDRNGNSGVAIQLKNNGDIASGTLKLAGGSGVTLFTNTTEALSTAGGNVKVAAKLGVGGVASSYQLEVHGTSATSTAFIKGTSNGASARLRVDGYNDSLIDFGRNGLGRWRFNRKSGTDDLSLIKMSNAVWSSTAEDSTLMFWDYANSRVAIGATIASNKLDLHFDATGENVTDGLRIQNVHGINNDFASIYFGVHGGTKKRKAAIGLKRTGSYGVGELRFAVDPNSTDTDVSFATDTQLILHQDGTHDHQGNRIVNSQTINDSWRTSEPSLRFDGSNDYVALGSVIDHGTSDFSYAAWVKIDTFSGSPGIISNRASSGTNVGCELRLAANNGIQVFLDFGSNTASVTKEGLVTGKWYHVAATIDRDGYANLYIDGVSEGTPAGISSLSSTSLTSAAEVRIGRNEATTYLDGEIKDVRIYNRAMEAAEIKGLYNGESTPFVYADSAGNVTPSTANSDASVWSKNSDATLTYDTDHMELANNTAAHGAYLTPANMGITATVGKRYRISAKLKNGTSSGVSVRLQAYPLTGDGLVDHTTTSSFVEVSTEFTATQAFTQVGVWPLSDLNNSNIEFKDFKFEEVGEVAAYTPKTIDAQHSQSAKHKWLDATSNNNHGSITGCTPVGDNDHRGILRVHSNSDAGSAYAHQHLNGTINIGSHNNYQGRIDYNATGGTEFLIDNSYNSNSAKTQFGMKTAGTRLPVLELVGDGSVKATSAASDNLKQVARVHSQNITFNSTTSAIAFRVLHNLGTKYVTVSVCENATSSGQNAAHVETEVRLGDYVGADIGAVSSQQSNTDENYVTIIFAAHQGNNTAFKVTVIG